jgi:hypothetical protein
MIKKTIVSAVLLVFTGQVFAKGVGYIERDAGNGFIDELFFSDVPKEPSECDGLHGHLAVRNLTDYRRKRSYDKVFGCWKLTEDKKEIMFVHRGEDGKWYRKYFDVDEVELL